VGGGLSYGNLGYSHHAIQDLGLMRLFPEFKIASPGDPIEVIGCLDNILNDPGPSYLRLKKSGEPNFNKIKKDFIPGIWNEVIPSKNRKIFLTTGGGLNLAHSYILNSSIHTDFGIYSCPIWGPRFRHLQQAQIDNFDQIITVEDHLFDCGFGSWIRESITDSKSHLKLSHKALDYSVIGKVGKEDFLFNISGLDKI
jgi:transketolase